LRSNYLAVQQEASLSQLTNVPSQTLLILNSADPTLLIRMTQPDSMQNHTVKTRSHLGQAKPHSPARRIPGLDGLRALAVIAVVWHHSHPGYAGFPLSHNGFLGVDVFFVLSGFLITTLLLQEERSTGGVSLIGFYIRRSLRIFPLYYAVLLLMAVFFVASTRSSNAAVFLTELPWHATYLSNWVSLKSMMAITWSLSTEEQFYLVWPPLFAWLGLRALWPLLVVLLFNQGINFGLFDAWMSKNGFAVDSLPLLQITFTPILLGVILAFGMQLRFIGRLKSSMPTWALLVMLAIALSIANTHGDIRGWPRMLFHMAIAGLVALVVLKPNSLIVKLLEWKPLTHIGLVSYGVYLFHMLVLHVIVRLFNANLLNYPTLIFVAALFFCVVLATLSYRYFELPFMGLKGRLIELAEYPRNGSRIDQKKSRSVNSEGM
jgi:peptidoglycan/LPS O-acetylase OafA/YrhL